MDTDYTGGVKSLEFNPAGRLAYNLSSKWAVSAEEYDGFGRLARFVPSDQQFHETWAVLDRNARRLNVETGIGVGWSGGADRVTLKLMLSRDLNTQPR